MDSPFWAGLATGAALGVLLEDDDDKPKKKKNRKKADKSAPKEYIHLTEEDRQLVSADKDDR